MAAALLLAFRAFWTSLRVLSSAVTAHWTLRVHHRPHGVTADGLEERLLFNYTDEQQKGGHGDLISLPPAPPRAQ